MSASMWKGLTAGSGKRIAILLVFASAIAIHFWSTSRYPDLDEKAVMGGETMLEDPLSFEAMIQFEEHAPALQRVVYTTINWINTNKRGMIFGLAMGAAFMSIIGLLRKRALQTGFGNTLMGVALGMPLGLCVNCAAPAARGIHQAGARLETTLAAMVSSPTLNVIVLTMVLAIFPLYLGVIKIGFTLAFILVAIPVLSRYAFPEELAQTIENAECAVDPPTSGAGESWGGALWGAVVDYLGSLWFIVRTTVPLMILAGFLGSLLATFVPLETFATVGTSFVTAVAVSLVGLFLPVPVAFDVVISAALLAAGMPILHVGILLFVLGIFSCYSTFIVATSISNRAAATLFVTLAATGLVAGYTADFYYKSELATFMASLDEISPELVMADEADASALPQVAAAAARATHPGAAHPAAPTGEIRVHHRAHQSPSPARERPFTRVEGDAMGLARENDMSVEEFWCPFYNGRGIASGDIDRDGWVDVVAATERGVMIFWNREGQRFEGERLDVRGAESLNVLVVALVDLDNDRWLDLYVTSFRSGNYTVFNHEGSFSGQALEKAPTGDVVLTHSASFGDIDGDGDLDAALGNWFFGGLARARPHELARNTIHFNEGGRFRSEPLPGMPGETLSILLSDWSRDGALDLVVANDLQQPDIFYLGDGKGGFKEITKEDGIIPESTQTSMSVDTADIDNDFELDIYIAQISARPTRVSSDVEIEQRDFSQYCVDVEDPAQREACQRNVEINGFYRYVRDHQPSDIEYCEQIGDPSEVEHCKLMMVMKTAVQTRDPRLCARIPSAHVAADICRRFFEPVYMPGEDEFARAIPQIKNENVLLMPSGNGHFENRAVELRAYRTAWSWNAKLADLDNDTWQDIYVVNGMWPRSSTTPSNVFLRNFEGKRFANLTEEYGLEDSMIVSAYTYLDFDGDGDLDIVTNAVNGPLKLFVNNETENRSLSFELDDHAGNRFGIGARIILYYDEEGTEGQMRELKAGGGYLSFDAPVAHFGLGERESVARAEVRWPDGAVSRIEGPLEAGQHYTIERL